MFLHCIFSWIEHFWSLFVAPANSLLQVPTCHVNLTFFFFFFYNSSGFWPILIGILSWNSFRICYYQNVTNSFKMSSTQLLNNRVQCWVYAGSLVAAICIALIQNSFWENFCRLNLTFISIAVEMKRSFQILPTIHF